MKLDPLHSWLVTAALAFLITSPGVSLITISIAINRWIDRRK